MLTGRFVHGAGAWHGAARGGRGLPRVAETVRAACTRSNLLLGTAVALGWLALVAWTGAGPESWQARLCAAPVGPAPACGAAGKDPSRVAPHIVAARVPS